MDSYQEIDEKFENSLSIPALPKLEKVREILVLHSGPKFMCWVVYICKLEVCILVPNTIAPEKVYAAIQPILEITSPKYHQFTHLKRYNSTLF